MVVAAVVVAEVVLGVVILLLLEEAGETEDGLADLEVEGDARDEADWEELVWRLDGMIDEREGETKRATLVVECIGWFSYRRNES